MINHKDTKAQRRGKERGQVTKFLVLQKLVTCPLFSLLCVFVVTKTLEAQTPAAVFTQYCVTCHNARFKTGGLVLDPGDLSHVSANPELWEKVVRKLRSQSMPPPGVPRPDPAAYESVSMFLETELDRAAAAKPNPGVLPLLHRLSRTEYANAIRDLLAIEALPKEMD